MLKKEFSNKHKDKIVRPILSRRPTRHLIPWIVALLIVVSLSYYTLSTNPKLKLSPRHSSLYIHKIESVLPWPEERWYEGPRNESQLERAALIMLVRNSELHPARSAMRQVEDRFNKRFGYPWVFVNDEPFTDEFIKLTSALATGRTEYTLIPKKFWSFPEWIDQGKARRNMEEMESRNILYGGSLSYRHMCRFNSGFFYRLDIMQKYDYYWRVEPYTEFYCDLYYDPFKFLRENNKVYGWVMSLYEFGETIPTLWQTVREFMAQNPNYIASDNAARFVVDDPKTKNSIEGSYNLCHFWSNFEIADLRFFRSKIYTEYFDYLDKTGGFFYERWGDAPIHSIAAAFFLPKSKIHFFQDIGYRHSPYIRCPQDDESHLSGRCSCEQGNNFDYDTYSCMRQWERVFKS